MTTRDESAVFQQRLARIEELIEQVQVASNPASKASLEELLAELLELHGSALKRMLDLIWESGETGREIIHDRLAVDDLAGGVLLLHGLHPVPIESRVEQALADVRPYLESHGGDVELVGVTDGAVTLRLKGTCESCPASSMTLRFAVEDAIYQAAPDVVSVNTDSPVADSLPAGFIPLETANGNGVDRSGWHDVEINGAMDDRRPLAIDVSGRSVLFLKLGDHYYAYANRCSNCEEPLESASLDGPALRCRSCGHSYDVIRAGRGLDRPSLSLAPFPLLVDDEHVRVALPD